MRRIDLSGQTVTTLAGTGRSGFLDGPAHQALFHEPCMLASDPNSGTVYVADSKNNAIRVILPPVVAVGGSVERTVVTLLGPPPSAPSRDAHGEGGMPVPLCVCELWRPWGVCLDSEGCLLISEAKSHRVRRLRDPLRFLTHELLARQLAAEEARIRAAVSGLPPHSAPPPILPLKASKETNLRPVSRLHSRDGGGRTRGGEGVKGGGRGGATGPDMGPRRAVSPSEELLDWRHSPEFDRFRQFLSGSPEFGQARDRDGGGTGAPVTRGDEGVKGGGGGNKSKRAASKRAASKPRMCTQTNTEALTQVDIDTQKHTGARTPIGCSQTHAVVNWCQKRPHIVSKET